jgi:hypothetical protein
VQHSTPDSTTDLVTSEFPRQLDIAQVSIYGLSFLSAGLFLFLPLVNLLHPSPWQRLIGTIHGMGAMFALNAVHFDWNIRLYLRLSACICG